MTPSVVAAVKTNDSEISVRQRAGVNAGRRFTSERTSTTISVSVTSAALITATP